ncbi:Retroviral aspartyl protease [Infirmifilum lucidum]|uniref:Retroviral aspartyl protease n=1 Tax=Infirmifilum lucidum TaxID=2776706 RepID=A0A7L9FHW0_9CREN|nr:aspartyl protease family protein [Infirmifilum lucidum]QOJ78952.1 Retroviral aspartyl protease [Infirmifilum lucidum]
MGVFKVRARVWNVFDRSKSSEVELVVDSESTYTVLPASLLARLGVTPARVVRLRVADGRVVEKKLGEVGIEVEGHALSATRVVFGDEDVYLLGSLTLEDLEPAVDPVKKKLVPTEALLMVAESP